MNFIIRTNKYIAAFYYVRERGVIRRTYQNGRWGAERIIAADWRENFTVHYQDETIYILSQDSNGDIVASSINDTDAAADSRIVLKNQSDRVSPVTLYPVITAKGFAIIYNAGGENGSGYLMTSRIDESGQWTPAERIDKYWGGFEAQRITNEHLLLFYQTREAADISLGYREYTPEKLGGYHVYYSTKYNVSDVSPLAADNGVHALFAVKNALSSRLIYRRNLTGSFDNPIVLYEAPRIENCLLFFVNNKLYITFMSAGALYICVSENKGESFSRPAQYRGAFCQDPEKAFFISQAPQSEGGIFLRQIYVDRSSPWDIQIIPELYGDFFPPDVEVKIGGDTEEVRRLKDQIEALRRLADEKDAMIARLTRQLKRRGKAGE